MARQRHIQALGTLAIKRPGPPAPSHASTILHGQPKLAMTGLSLYHKAGLGSKPPAGFFFFFCFCFAQWGLWLFLLLSLALCCMAFFLFFSYLVLCFPFVPSYQCVAACFFLFLCVALATFLLLHVCLSLFLSFSYLVLLFPFVLSWQCVGACFFLFPCASSRSSFSCLSITLLVPFP